MMKDNQNVQMFKEDAKYGDGKEISRYKDGEDQAPKKDL